MDSEKGIPEFSGVSEMEMMPRQRFHCLRLLLQMPHSSSTRRLSEIVGTGWLLAHVDTLNISELRADVGTVFLLHLDGNAVFSTLCEHYTH